MPVRPCRKEDYEGVAYRLLEFLDGQPDHELKGVDLAKFYELDPDFKEIVKSAAVPGRIKGVRSLCAMFPTKLAFRKVAQEKGCQMDVIIMRAADVEAETEDLVKKLSVTLAMSDDKNDSGQKSLKAIDAMLKTLKLELGSMNKLKQEVGTRGICLRDGSEHGEKLRSALRNQKALTVNVNRAKKYQYARTCLVVV